VRKSVKWLLLALLAIPLAVGFVFFVLGSFSSYSDLSLLPGRKIGLVRVEEVIYNSDKFVGQLRSFYKDKSIVGVIVRINSPGGGVSASQDIFREILRYKTGGKPLVVSMQSVAASGGYYIACPARKIFATPGTITGSIGVIFEIPHFYNLLNKLGIHIETIKAGKFKDIGSPQREMTPEERAFLQNVLDDTHRQFIDDVCTARPAHCDSIRAVADGRIFTGRQAIKIGLIDTLGSYEDALDYLKKITDVPEQSNVIEIKEKVPFLKSLLSENADDAFSFFQRVFHRGGIYYLYNQM
jgi:protease-4